jgi:hypothetical protein
MFAVLWRGRIFKAEFGNKFSFIVSKCLNLEPKPTVCSNTFVKILNQFCRLHTVHVNLLATGLCKLEVGKTFMFMSG